MEADLCVLTWKDLWDILWEEKKSQVCEWDIQFPFVWNKDIDIHAGAYIEIISKDTLEASG